jgi:hypothetical protein
MAHEVRGNVDTGEGLEQYGDEDIQLKIVPDAAHMAVVATDNNYRT